MLQSAKALADDLGPVRVDAAVGRQIGQGITILERREETGGLAQTVIVQLGNNGPFYDGQFDEVMAALRDVPTVIWINVRVPRDWEAHNNRIIASGVARYPNARMVDWNAATDGPARPLLERRLPPEAGRRQALRRPGRGRPPLTDRTRGGQPPAAISRLRRATKASSASTIAGSSGGGTASASRRFQIVLARSVAVREPSACHVSKLRQSETSGR